MRTYLGAYPYICIQTGAYYEKRWYFRELRTLPGGRSWGDWQKEKLNLTTLADDYNISRQSVTKHIRILEGCGLVTIEKQGRDRCVTAKPEKLVEVSRWVEQFSSFFAASFDRLDDYLKNME